MKRAKFDGLKLIEQVNYINKKLENGETLTNICKSIGIGRSTIRDRFKGISYEYNKTTKQYESFIEIIDNELCITAIEDDIKQGSSNKVVGAVPVNNKVLEELILNYKDMNNKLNEVYKWYQKSSNKVVIKDKKLNIEVNIIKLQNSMKVL